MSIPSFVQTEMKNRVKRDTWYLMKAHHIKDGRSCLLTDIIAEQKGYQYTIFLTVTQEGPERYCSSSGHVSDYKIDQQVNWINDTGMGHRSPKYLDDIMLIKNIIHVDKDGNIVYQSNDNGVDKKRRSTFVFK